MELTSTDDCLRNFVPTTRRSARDPLRRGQDSEARTRRGRRDLLDYYHRDALAMTGLVATLEG